MVNKSKIEKSGLKPVVARLECVRQPSTAQIPYQILAAGGSSPGGYRGRGITGRKGAGGAGRAGRGAGRATSGASGREAEQAGGAEKPFANWIYAIFSYKSLLRLDFSELFISAKEKEFNEFKWSIKVKSKNRG